jgi:hypothetical protein
MTISISCTGIEKPLKEIQETSLVKTTDGESKEMMLANDPKSLNSYVIS